ncbi:glycosyltransferase [Pseudooceanicola sp. CBS1P-1]|uniref:Glycosyltransferase n=1 Tax=Pseudooceanicola albus TaxID=2692189 RepID=A0A6L7GAU0_9RHOB|nr:MULTISPECIES: glycosyltransferase [Pseudooceanicola]MBT9386715.1 glycosyltransferase [Pseudooceanicola endophyticus]MXN20802.1 glycosyltransferase [Pseudooceanicola albus]
MSSKIPQKKNKAAFDKFDDHLRVRRIEVTEDTGFDIRAHVLQSRFADWNIGYVKNTMENGYGSNLPLLFPSVRNLDDPGFGRSGKYLLLGTVFQNPENSHVGAVRALTSFSQGDELVLTEQGFLASSHSWSAAFKGQTPEAACLGYVYDDMAYYFMADYPNRLIHRLNSGQELTEEERQRARAMIDRIVARKISKYNSQPIHLPTLTEGYTRRVLVCDQAFADASTIYGKVDEEDFQQMLMAAIRENPDAEILVKTHPDTFWEKGRRVGYFNHLQSYGRVRILRDPLNPFCLFEHVDKVYAGTSQMGLEALLAGKEVVLFGCPFYAGWGLTDDRKTIPHRHRTRSLEELFHYFYIWYTIYHVPGCPIPSQIEDALDFIEQNRPVQLPPALPAQDLTAQDLPAPKVSVILPVYGVEKYIEACIASIQRQTLHDIEIIPVNDQSPDSSQAIIDRMAAEDPRIRPLILPENQGQGFARNAGLARARGDYILFLDSDDMLDSADHLERCVATAIEDRADMVRGRKSYEQVEDAQGKILRKQPDWCEVHFDTPFHGSSVAQEPRILHGRHFWTWMYRRDFLEKNDIRFLTPQWEERPFLLKALLKAERVSGILSNGFIYRVRSDSTARRPKNLRDCDFQLSNFESLVDMLQEAGAFAPDSPLAEVARFQVSQFLHFTLFGFVFKTLREAGTAQDMAAFHDRLHRLVLQTGLSGADLTSAPLQMSQKHVSAEAYRFLFECLRSQHFEQLETAIALAPIPQEDLLEALLRVPETALEADYQTALSLYARNERVRMAQAAPAPAGPKPRLLIHVGSTKTGSTFIQHFLERNRAALLRAGIYYPEVGLFWQEDRPHKQAGHSAFTREAVSRNGTLKQHVETALALAGGRIHTIILTSEAYFLNRRSLEIARYFEGYPVEMIGYFRRQDEWANSQYAEFVAGGAIGRVSQPIAEWLRDPLTRERLDYLSYLELWSAEIGRANVHARVYDRKAFAGGDVVADFMTTLGLSAQLSLPRPEAAQANDFPFNAAHVEMIRPYNGENWPNPTPYLRFIDEVTKRIAAYQKAAGIRRQKVTILTAQQRRELLRDCEDGNASIARLYLGREDGVLFPAPGPQEDIPQQAISQTEIAIITDAFARHRPAPAVAAKKAKPAAAKSAPGKAAPLADPDEAMRQTVLYKAFSGLARPLLSTRKQGKLQKRPGRFFDDSRNPVLRGAGQLIRFESDLRFPATALEAAPLSQTLTYRLFSTAAPHVLSERKAGKLRKKPAAFFEDMKGGMGRSLRSCLRMEMRLRKMK